MGILLGGDPDRGPARISPAAGRTRSCFHRAAGAVRTWRRRKGRSDHVATDARRHAARHDALAAFICPTRRTAVLYRGPGAYQRLSATPAHSEEADWTTPPMPAPVPVLPSVLGRTPSPRRPLRLDPLRRLVGRRRNLFPKRDQNGRHQRRREQHVVAWEKYMNSDVYYDGLDGGDDGTAFQGHGYDVARHAGITYVPVPDTPGLAAPARQRACQRLPLCLLRRLRADAQLHDRSDRIFTVGQPQRRYAIDGRKF